MRLIITADPEITVPPGEYGGVQRLVAQWVTELRTRGHQVALMARPGSTLACDRFFPWPGLQSQRPADTWRNAWALLRAARAFQADVVHSSSRLLYTWPLLLARVPVLMTYHRAPGIRQIALANRLGGRLAFSGVSRYIMERGRGGGGDWHCVYNCIDLAELNYQPVADPDAPLVYLSRIDADKGAHLAIEIARRSGRRLVLAGNHSADANATRYWRELIQPQIDGTQISYVGPVGPRQKNELLGRARALLVPTQCDEAFGLVYAEALACGTPAIGTFRGAVPEIIEPGRTGWLMNDVDEGLRAVANLDGLSRAACRQTAEDRFGIPRIVDGYEAIYRQLAAGPRPSAP